jgi:hypothetical protein
MEICVHGNNGQIQNPGTKAYHTGWGIDYDVAGTGSWLQYSIQINAGTKIKKIRIVFSKDGQHYKMGWIRHVHIYDGPNLIKKFDNLYLGKDSVDKTINTVLDLGQSKQFNYGVGVSILPETKTVPGLSAIVNFELHSVCAITD